VFLGLGLFCIIGQKTVGQKTEGGEVKSKK